MSLVNLPFRLPCSGLLARPAPQPFAFAIGDGRQYAAAFRFARCFNSDLGKSQYTPQQGALHIHRMNAARIDGQLLTEQNTAADEDFVLF